jgi:hypothetical protein
MPPVRCYKQDELAHLLPPNHWHINRIERTLRQWPLGETALPNTLEQYWVWAQAQPVA